MQRRTFLIGAAGLIAAPAAAWAAGGWSPPVAVHFEPGLAEMNGRSWPELEAAHAAFKARPNPRNGDWVRVFGYMDEAERAQIMPELPLRRAKLIGEGFGFLNETPNIARPRAGSGLVVDVAGPSAANRVALISWTVRT
ncbi:MAG: hypothetical protein QM608_13795 [Caulobacter sp.]